MAKRAIRAALAPLVPADRPGDFAQALMDLGAPVCTPRRPACGICPVMADCRARGRADLQRLPVKPPTTAKPHRAGLADWVELDGAIWLIRGTDKNRSESCEERVCASVLFSGGEG